MQDLKEQFEQGQLGKTSPDSSASTGSPPEDDSEKDSSKKVDSDKTEEEKEDSPSSLVFG